MSNQATLTTLALSVRRRMNLVNMNTVSDTELISIINDSLAQLYEVLCSAWRDYFVNKFTITFTANQEGYALPDDFRACAAVYLTSTTSGTSTRRFQLQQFNLNQFNNIAVGDVRSNSDPCMYRIMGEQIYFTPVPSGTPTSKAEMWYIPAWSAPADNNTTISRVLPNGWELWVILDACCSIATRMRLLEFYQLFSAERQRVEKRVIAAASIRDETAPQMVNQFDQSSNYFFGGGF